MAGMLLSVIFALSKVINTGFEMTPGTSRRRKYHSGGAPVFPASKIATLLKQYLAQADIEFP